MYNMKFAEHLFQLYFQLLGKF